MTAWIGTTGPSPWSQLLADVHMLKAKGYAPISLAEGGQWRA